MFSLGSHSETLGMIRKEGLQDRLFCPVRWWEHLWVPTGNPGSVSRGLWQWRGVGLGALEGVESIGTHWTPDRKGHAPARGPDAFPRMAMLALGGRNIPSHNNPHCFLPRITSTAPQGLWSVVCISASIHSALGQGWWRGLVQCRHSLSSRESRSFGGMTQKGLRAQMGPCAPQQNRGWSMGTLKGTMLTSCGCCKSLNINTRLLSHSSGDQPSRWAEMEVLAGLCSFWGLWGRSHTPPFPASGGAHICWLWAMAVSPLLPSPHPSLSLEPCHPLMITLAPANNPGQ